MFTYEMSGCVVTPFCVSLKRFFLLSTFEVPHGFCPLLNIHGSTDTADNVGKRAVRMEQARESPTENNQDQSGGQGRESSRASTSDGDRSPFPFAASTRTANPPHTHNVVQSVLSHSTSLKLAGFHAAHSGNSLRPTSQSTRPQELHISMFNNLFPQYENKSSSDQPQAVSGTSLQHPETGHLLNQPVQRLLNFFSDTGNLLQQNTSNQDFLFDAFNHVPASPRLPNSTVMRHPNFSNNTLMAPMHTQLPDHYRARDFRPLLSHMQRETVHEREFPAAYPTRPIQTLLPDPMQWPQVKTPLNAEIQKQIQNHKTRPDDNRVLPPPESVPRVKSHLGRQRKNTPPIVKRLFLENNNTLLRIHDRLYPEHLEYMRYLEQRRSFHHAPGNQIAECDGIQRTSTSSMLIDPSSHQASPQPDSHSEKVFPPHFSPKTLREVRLHQGLIRELSLVTGVRFDCLQFQTLIAIGAPPIVHMQNMGVFDISPDPILEWKKPSLSSYPKSKSVLKSKLAEPSKSTLKSKGTNTREWIPDDPSRVGKAKLRLTTSESTKGRILEKLLTPDNGMGSSVIHNRSLTAPSKEVPVPNDHTCSSTKTDGGAVQLIQTSAKKSKAQPPTSVLSALFQSSKTPQSKVRYFYGEDSWNQSSSSSSLQSASSTRPPSSLTLLPPLAFIRTPRTQLTGLIERQTLDSAGGLPSMAPNGSHTIGPEIWDLKTILGLKNDVQVGAPVTIPTLDNDELTKLLEELPPEIVTGTLDIPESHESLSTVGADKEEKEEKEDEEEEVDVVNPNDDQSDEPVSTLTYNEAVSTMEAPSPIAFDHVSSFLAEPGEYISSFLDTDLDIDPTIDDHNQILPSDFDNSWWELPDSARDEAILNGDDLDSIAHQDLDTNSEHERPDSDSE